MRLSAPALLAMILAAAPGGTAPAPALHDLRPAFQAADRAADAVVLLQYVLRKTGEGFGAAGQRVRLATAGVIVSADGLVLLPGSIFPEDEEDSRDPARPEDFVARLRDGQRVPGTLVGWDRDRSLALLRLEPASPRTFPHVTFDDSVPLEPGDPIVMTSMLPEKYQSQSTFVAGRVAAALPGPRRLFDVDVHVQETMLGGPVLDAGGRVVGVLSTDPLGESGPGPLAAPLKFIGSITRGKEPGFPVLVPVSEIAALLDSPPPVAMRTASARAWLGVTLQPVPRALADYLHLPSPTGVMVTSVWKGSPSERAGLLLEDVIVGFSGKPVQAPDDAAVIAFVDRVREAAIDVDLPLRVVRGGQSLDLTVRLTKAPTTSVRAEEYRNASFGLAVQDVTVDMIMARSWPDDTAGAVVTDVETAGWAQVGGLREGDLVLAVSGRPVAGVADLEAALVAATTDRLREVIFFVQRDPDTLFIPVKTAFK